MKKYKENFKDKKMNIIGENAILECKSEKEIQSKIQLYLEKNSNTKIIEEEFLKIPTLDDKKFLIKESFDYNGIKVIGLKYKLYELNDHIFQKYSHLDKWDITNQIFENFEEFHRTSDNVSIKDAIFNHELPRPEGRGFRV